jgi:hypothetical protein
MYAAGYYKIKPIYWSITVGKVQKNSDSECYTQTVKNTLDSKNKFVCHVMKILVDCFLGPVGYATNT